MYVPLAHSHTKKTIINSIPCSNLGIFIDLSSLISLSSASRFLATFCGAMYVQLKKMQFALILKLIRTFVYFCMNYVCKVIVNFEQAITLWFTLYHLIKNFTCSYGNQLLTQLTHNTPTTLTPGGLLYRP